MVKQTTAVIQNYCIYSACTVPVHVLHYRILVPEFTVPYMKYLIWNSVVKNKYYNAYSTHCR